MKGRCGVEATQFKQQSDAVAVKLHSSTAIRGCGGEVTRLKQQSDAVAVKLHGSNSKQALLQ
jgi:hypothetical protein